MKWLHWFSRPDPIDALIVPPRPIVGCEQADESLPLKAARRREAAAAKRVEAARIASGQPVEERFHLVRGVR